jgi:hypothetical protein
LSKSSRDGRTTNIKENTIGIGGTTTGVPSVPESHSSDEPPHFKTELGATGTGTNGAGDGHTLTEPPRFEPELGTRRTNGASDGDTISYQWKWELLHGRMERKWQRVCV